MLNDLKILNGEMPLKFDSLNTTYTINVKPEVKELLLEYDIPENYHISIFNNNLDKEINEVVLTVYNDTDQTSYYLYVYKEENKEVTSNISTKENLEITKNDMPIYIAPSIASVCFIFILLFFTLLFKKNIKK